MLLSGELDNQTGLIQSRQAMKIDTHQGNLNNQRTQKATAQSPVRGIIALGELALATQKLLNQQGYLLSQQAQTLKAQSIDNEAGTIASQARQNITTNDTIRNTQGRISGQSSTLKAREVDNQAGLLQGENLLVISAQEHFTNLQGQTKAKDRLQIEANAVNNRQGQMRATAGTLSVLSNTTLDNTEGTITAKQNATLNAKGLTNHKGLIYNEQGLLTLTLHQQALDNREGRVIGKADLAIESGALANQQGSLYAEKQGRIHVEGQIDNQQNGKIHGLGELEITAHQMDNRGGEIRAQEALTLNIETDLNNQKVGTSGSFIESGNTLILNATAINNRETQSATETMAQGILASVLSLSAQILDNQQGQIHSRQKSHLNITQTLNNQQGEITGNQEIAIEGKDLHINNQDGRLQGETSLSIVANEVTTNGHIEGAEVAIHQQKDFVTQRPINADRSLTITTQGNLTNQHTLYADERVLLEANHITNAITGRISSANTEITAKGNLTNEGLINSVNLNTQAPAKTVVKVGGRLTNKGKGRIYGDEVALQADTFENSDKDYGNGEIKAAIVAARGRLDIAAREIENNSVYYLSDNQIGSTLFSVGEMVLGRHLNEENHARGNAEALRNNSSLIETESNLTLNAHTVNNNNSHFVVEHVVTGKAPNDITLLQHKTKALREHFIIPKDGYDKLPETFLNKLNEEKGSLSNNPYIPMKYLRWQGWERAGQLVYKSDGTEPTILKLGDKITPDMVLATPNQMSCDDYSNVKGACHYEPAGQYGIDSPIWAHFNATAPAEAAPHFPFDQLAAQPWYDERDWFSADDTFKVPENPGSPPTKPIKRTHEKHEMYDRTTCAL